MEEKEVIKKSNKKIVEDKNKGTETKKVGSVKKVTSKTPVKKDETQKKTIDKKEPEVKKKVSNKKEDNNEKKEVNKKKTTAEKNKKVLEETSKEVNKNKTTATVAKRKNSKVANEEALSEEFEASTKKISKVKKIQPNNEKDLKDIIETAESIATKETAKTKATKASTKSDNAKVEPKKVSTTKKSETKSKAVSTSAKTTKAKTESTEKKNTTKKNSSTTKSKIAGNVNKASSEKSGKIKINNTTKKNVKNTKKDTNETKEINKEPENNEIEDAKDVKIYFIEKELSDKFDMEKLDEKIKNRKFISKTEKFSIFKSSFYNIIFAIVFILFLVFCNYGFYNVAKKALIKDINLFSFLFLGISLLLIESAYKEDKVSKCINGIETLIMGIYTLVIPYILQIYTQNFIKILWITGASISIYYIIKSIIAFIINRNKFLRNKNDISKEESVSSELEEDEEID